MRQPEKNWNKCSACHNPIEPGFEMLCIECDEQGIMCDGCFMHHRERKHDASL